MNPLKLLNPSYLFDPTPGASFMYFWPLFIIFILIFLSSWKVKKLINKELLAHIPGRMREFAIIGLLLTFFRNENIPYLGMRFLLILFFIIVIAYAVWTYKKYKKDSAIQIVEKQHTDQTDKYLPRPKKKRKKKR